MNRRLALGLDYGTESARALLVDVETGEELATDVLEYPHGVMDDRLPDSGVKLEPEWALQDPEDYLLALRTLIPNVLKQANVQPEEVIGVGVDFTACTVLPADENYRPLCMDPELRNRPHAWVKLWKHHAAQEEADRMTAVAKETGETFLNRYGGTISSEWLWPKIWQVLNEDPELYDRAARFIEAGDWIVQQLTGVDARSACQAGYKGCWSSEAGYPSKEFLRALDPRLEDLVGSKVQPDVHPLGAKAGELNERGAELTGLKPGTPVAVSVIDAHVAAPAATMVRPGQLLMIMGTSLCHMALGPGDREVKGVAGVVKDGILPDFHGYEAGQAAVGDIFVWFTRHGVPASYAEEANREGKSVYDLLEERAAALRPGESGVLALDWWNGSRSPVMDSALSGMMVGVTLETRPEDLYRALIEATAFGTRRIVETLRDQGVPVDEILCCGGLAEKNDLLMQIYADVLQTELKVARSSQACALGSAMWGAVAAGAGSGGYDSIQDAAGKMAGLRPKTYPPNPAHREVYDALYAEYLTLARYFGEGGNDVMRRLRALRHS
ncbi:MAG: ribulokinase [Armatimonadetes bacterium]|nr:ribulokinase [Armatimonadota bacterium]